MNKDYMKNFLIKAKHEKAITIATHNLASNYYKDMLNYFYCPYCGGQKNESKNERFSNGVLYQINICCKRANDFIKDLEKHCRQLPELLGQLMGILLPAVKEDACREWVEKFEGLKIQALGNNHRERTFNAFFIIFEHVSNNLEDDYADIFEEAYSVFKEAYSTNDLKQLEKAMSAIFDMGKKVLDKVMA